MAPRYMVIWGLGAVLVTAGTVRVVRSNRKLKIEKEREAMTPPPEVAEEIADHNSKDDKKRRSAR